MILTGIRQKKSCLHHLYATEQLRHSNDSKVRGQTKNQTRISGPIFLLPTQLFHEDRLKLTECFKHNEDE